MHVASPPLPLEMAEALSLAPEIRSHKLVGALLEKATELYLPWDQFRFQPLSPNISKEAVWHYLRALRQLQLQALLLKDESGAPFFYSVPPGGAELFNQIDRRIAGAVVEDETIARSRERFITSSLMEEAIASSQLEGAHTTRQEAKKMLREGRLPHNKAERMIFNNWRTMEHVLTLRDEPLSLTMLLEIHALVTQDTMPDPLDSGQLRSRDDVRVEDIRSGDILHQPPPFERLPARLEALFAWVNDDQTQWIHPLAKASLLHFFIGYEHPFVDGNGRTARALFYWFMLSRGYWLFEHLAISRFLLRAPVQYGRSYIYCETDQNDTTYFIAHSLKVVKLALDDMQNYLHRKSQEVESVSALGVRLGLNERQQAVIGHAKTHPQAVYTFALHQKLHRVTYQTARTDLMGLAEKGLLLKNGVGKKFVFSPTPELLL